jgi:uncharacterized protein (TIGR03435 family)
VTNHLWQSTLFAIAAGLLTLAFRKNRAQVRYWMWFSASIKFFLPLALLMSLGSRFEPSSKSIAAPAISDAIEQVTEPFPETVSFTTSFTPIQGRDWRPFAIISVWACGFAAIALIRIRGWLRIQAAVRAAVPMEIPSTIAVRASPGLLEPGVVGFLNPILLVPDGIAERLTPSQLSAVLAHELCHIRRRDNLTSAIHMLVEALFWFHPLVWWIGARLVEERERACDESVLSLGNEPQVYAEAILNVCKLYVESPLACVSGVTGSDLKKRIEVIMTNRMVLRLNFAKKVALAFAGIAALAVPIAVGMMNTPHLRAQSAPLVIAAPVIAPPADEPPVEPPAVPQSAPPTDEAQKAPAESNPEPSPLDPKTYLIGPGDVLSIAVFHESDLTRDETVRADGKIRMPLIGEIQAEGLTPIRLAAQIREALATYIVNPDVTVTVLQVNSKRVAAIPVFETASIKPCGSGDTGGRAGGGRSGASGTSGPSPDRLSLNCQTLRSLIRMAYVSFADGQRLAPRPLSPLDGGPSWLDSERYQITAKAEGTPGQNMMRGPMLQVLLEDRFRVKVHQEIREVPVYDLTVAKGGPKLPPTGEGSCISFETFESSKEPAGGKFPTFCGIRRLGTLKKPALTWEVPGGTLDELATSLGGDLDRIVMNKTGIAGKFDFKMEFSADETTVGLNSLRGPDGPVVQPDPSGGPSIFAAIREQLGLKLESAKGQRRFLVIDRAEKPSEN